MYSKQSFKLHLKQIAEKSDAKAYSQVLARSLSGSKQAAAAASRIGLICNTGLKASPRSVY